MFVVLGATGNTGRAAATHLLEAGHDVRVVARSRERLQPLVDRGAGAAVGDASDPAFLSRAFAGADGVYALLPPDPVTEDHDAHYDRAAAAIEQGLIASGVRRVVFLSSQGAQHPEGTGPVRALHPQERRLAALDLDLTILRPGYFFENHFASLPLIKAQGINGGAIEPNVPFTMIATADIGAIAAAELARPGAGGAEILDLYGPRDLTMAEATSIIGAALGRPDLAYIRFPDEAYAEALAAAGLSRHFAGLLVELAYGISDGLVVGTTPRTPRNTATTTLEAFAPQLAAAYAAL